MVVFKRLLHPKYFLILSLILYCCTLFFTYFDIRYRWFALSLQIISFFLVLFVYLLDFFSKHSAKHVFTKKEVIPLCSILALSCVCAFLFLQTYPFVSVGDEVRDAGIEAAKIVHNQFFNFAGFSYYNGFGTIISVLASFFYRIFGTSDLSYRVPAAIIGTLDIFLFYIFLRIQTNKLTAFIGALIYLSFPLHLYYERTELVVIFDGFWTNLLLLLTALWIEKRGYWETIMLANVIGTACMFHTSSKIMALLTAAFAALFLVKDYVTGRSVFPKKIVLFALFVIIGFGPMLMQSTFAAFFQTNRNELLQSTIAINYSRSDNEIATLAHNYIESLAVWFLHNTESSYPESHPLLPPFLALFFLIGFVVLLRQKKPFSYFLVALLFILPLTNSALTDWLNAVHRLLPLLPLAAYFTTIGLMRCINIIRISQIRTTLIGVFVAFIFWQLWNYFTTFPANYNRSISEFMEMHLVYQLQHKDYQNSTICLLVSPSTKITLDLRQYEEQRRFFIPNVHMQYKAIPTIPLNKAYINHGTCEKQVLAKQYTRHQIDCAKQPMFCPLKSKDNITIYTE